MPLSSVLSDLRGLLDNAISILTEPPQQASADFFDYSQLQRRQLNKRRTL